MAVLSRPRLKWKQEQRHNLEELLKNANAETPVRRVKNFETVAMEHLTKPVALLIAEPCASPQVTHPRSQQVTHPRSQQERNAWWAPYPETSFQLEQFTNLGFLKDARKLSPSRHFSR